jgi:methionyl-tRNA formyltransferase
MGTPDYAVVTLKTQNAAGQEIAAVKSQPPRPAGRGQSARSSPVQEYAAAQGIEVRTPLSLKSADEQKSFADLKADAAVVVAYGLLLPQALLDGTRFGCFNVHASLLPRWRGAAPIQRAIMAGDAESGVTIMRMELGLDTGPMMKVGRVPITPETTASSLHDELAVLGAKLMVEVLQHPEKVGISQPAESVTYARKIDKVEAKIDFTKPAVEVRNHVHGLSPFPGAWCILAGARVKILKAQAVDHAGDDALTFACGSGAIKFLSLQREGKGSMDAATFLRGFPIAPDMKPA